MKKRNALLLISLMAGLSTQAAVREDWSFDDQAGTLLSGAANTGVDNGSFAAGGDGIFKTDGSGFLNCTPNGANKWDVSSVVDAAPINTAASDVMYFRYDLKYDLPSGTNETGMTTGLFFVDDSGNNIAGLALEYDADNVEESAPADETRTPVAGAQELELSGTLSAVAKVDTTASTITVWYDSTGNNDFSAAPTTASINLSSISGLRIRATGESKGTTNDLVAVENIRVADSWEEITADAKPSFDVTVTDATGGGMRIGSTNTLTVVIKNTGTYARNITSALSWDSSPSSFTIISNDTPTVSVLQPTESTTHTYTVVANGPDGLYTFTATGASDAGNGSGTFLMGVGKLLSYASNNISNDTPGIYPNTVEPGETFDIEVFTQNRGGETVSNISNSLLPLNATAFPLVEAITSANYDSMAKSETTSTTYRVTCADTAAGGFYTFRLSNSTTETSWINDFQIEVVLRAEPTIATNALTIHVDPGSTATGSINLSNSGNASIDFQMLDNGAPADGYDYKAIRANREVFLYTPAHAADLEPNTVFTDWTESWQWKNKTYAATPFKAFEFPLFNNKYSYYQVSLGGQLILATDTTGANATNLNICAGATFSADSMRYKQTDHELLIAWGNRTGHECQIRLNADNTFQYFYQAGNWEDGTIAIGDEEIDYTPGSTTEDCLIFWPNNWVSYSDQGTVSGFGGSNSLEFSANAIDQTEASTNWFTTTITWSDGTSEEVEVTVIVNEPVYSLTAPNTLSFSGQAGFISSPANMTIQNTGNTTINYTLTDTGSRSSGYDVQATDYAWYDASTFIDSASMDETPVDIGFPFVFAGNVYSSVTVKTDGSLMFADGEAIIPFSNELRLDQAGSVKTHLNASKTWFAVTWINVPQPSDQTLVSFQVVLYRSGAIRCNYKPMSGNWTNDAVTALQYTDGTTVNEASGAQTLIDDITVSTVEYSTETTFTTNTYAGGIETVEDHDVTVTNIVKTIPDPAPRHSIEFTPAQSSWLSATPLTGTMLKGTSGSIDLRADARNMDAGTYSTTLTLTYEGGTTDCTVDFNATDPMGGDEVVHTAAMWGSENPTVSSTQDADTGVRTLSWPGAPNDDWSRTYKVWFTTSLGNAWTELATVVNGTTFVDDSHNDVTTIFYKVTVQ